MRARLRRTRLGSAWLLGALVMAGCGPGVGGTGTGSAAFAAFGASPTPVCGGAVAAALSCPRRRPCHRRPARCRSSSPMPPGRSCSS